MTLFRFLILLAIVAYLATGITQIGPDERGLVRRFGQVVAQPGPGLHIGLPWGFDRVDRVSVKSVRQLTVGDDDNPLSLLTGDQNLVMARFVMEYAVDETELDRFVMNQDQLKNMLQREAESASGEWAAGKDVDSILLTGRVELANRLQRLLPARIAPQRFGIQLQRISVELLSPPEEVREAFSQVNEAQSAMLTKENQARQEAQRRQREAETMRTKFTNQAEASRNEKLTAAQADAEVFSKRLAQYRTLKQSNPNILQSIWWDETGKMLLAMKGKSRIDLLDSHLGKDGLDISNIFPPKKR